MTDDRIFTQAVHAGEGEKPPEGRPVSTAIYPATTYLYSDTKVLSDVLGFERPGYSYIRYGSPTVGALEKAVAVLENADGAVAVSSGMAALHLALLQAGAGGKDAVVAAGDLYGATRTLLKKMVADEAGLRFVDITNLREVEQAVTECRPRAVLFEILTNPLLKVADLPSIAAIAHAAGVEVIVDSTFTTPYLIQPLRHGADVVVHSATKYLGGHGDVLGGVIAAGEKHIGELRELLKSYGSNLGPFEAWTVLRGIKTLPLRMREQCMSALRVAEWLRGRPEISSVWYPGLEEHPHHRLAASLFRDKSYGGMVAFELRAAGQREVYRFMESLRLIRPGTSLGDVYSLLLYPSISSHRALTPHERHRLGITDGVVRLSVGIEAVSDIIADLEQGLRTLF